MTAPTSLRTVTLAERPEFGPAILELLASRWPTFMLAGHPGHNVDLPQLLALQAPQYQVLLIDDDRLLGAGLSAPVAWDGTEAGLPGGWDAAVTASAELLAAGRTPTVTSALSVTLTAEATGRGLAGDIIRAMKAAAVNDGLTGMLAPVRPVWKTRYPLIPLQRYVTWRNADGDVFDPWLRLHLGLGAHQLAVADSSMTVTGTVAEWETWTGMPLPDSGDHIIPGGLEPLRVDIGADLGVYREASVWVHHPSGESVLVE
jgi:hypothetical protein